LTTTFLVGNLKPELERLPQLEAELERLEEDRRRAEKARRRRILSLVAVPVVVLIAAVASVMVLVERGATADRPEVAVAEAPVVAPAPEPPEIPSKPKPEPKPKAEPKAAAPQEKEAPREAAPREEASTFDAGALQTDLEELLADRKGRWGAVVYEPGSGETVAVGSDQRFVAASIAKLPALLTLYRSAAQGGLSLDEKITIEPQDVSDYGTGELHKYPAGSSVTLRECAWYLVNQSDNTAWAMLNRRLGPENIRAELDEIGATSTNYEELNYLTTPDDVMLMLKKISDPEYTNEQLSNEMLDAMTDTAFEDRIPAGLPAGTRVAHKIGSFEGSYGDAGVVFYKDESGKEQRYFVVAMSGETDENQARDIIQVLSEVVHDAIARPRGKQTP
jgi:beta-lactamase class A